MTLRRSHWPRRRISGQVIESDLLSRGTAKVKAAARAQRRRHSRAAPDGPETRLSRAKRQTRMYPNKTECIRRMYLLQIKQLIVSWCIHVTGWLPSLNTVIHISRNVYNTWWHPGWSEGVYICCIYRTSLKAANTTPKGSTNRLHVTQQRQSHAHFGL